MLPAALDMKHLRDGYPAYLWRNLRDEGGFDSIVRVKVSGLVA
jgi:hypothetical protein